jgi:hypothetical protein
MDARYPPIGITGHKGAGKDTVARILVARYGYRAHGYSDVLKEHLYAALSPDVRGTKGDFLAHLEAHKHDPLDSAEGWCRQLMQAWGQAHRQLGGPTYWCRLLEVLPRQVIPSVRHPEEVVHLRRHGALLWRIHRPGTAPDGHPSEAHIPHLQVDAELHNHGSIDDLAAQVHRLMAAQDLVEEAR